jgi:hypothetical protein
LVTSTDRWPAPHPCCRPGTPVRRRPCRRRSAHRLGERITPEVLHVFDVVVGLQSVDQSL